MIFRLIVLVLFLMFVGCQSDIELETEDEKRSYSLGVDFGYNVKQILQQQGIKVVKELFAQGVEDVILDQGTKLDESEIKEILQHFREELSGKQEEQRVTQQAEQNQVAEENKKEGEVFLTENKKKEGVKTLPSGLQYRVIKKGTGNIPSKTSKVLCHYRGRLINGKEFDSSYSRGEPTEFSVNGVIAGWTEALQLMKEGGKWELFVPSKLAYGQRGVGGIGPNATLIFEIELIKVK